jgi:DNA-binding NtrC family response regulator
MPSVLLVDADRNFREALAIALRLDGFHVASCGSSEEAVRWLRVARFDACVSDARLGGLDGLAAAASRSGMRLLLTAPHLEVATAAARRHPRAEVIAKPIRPADLVHRLAGGAAA